ncbi:MAG TPA: YdiU family protein [Gammaproteobacteria bacterium]
MTHSGLDIASVLRFDNRFTRELPADPVAANTRRQVAGACYSRVQPKKVSNPVLVACSREVAAMLGLSEAHCRSRDFVEVFSGNRALEGMDPHAMCYGGHQFGRWAGQLGDGRAINLGEVVGESGEHWTLQLKGAGPTPYSRTADGLAVLRSSIREFLCSEAMHHLGVPTTRALSLVTTGEEVMRDMFYDGNARPEPGAIVCRVAPSFTRFGNFEIFAARGDLKGLAQLLDFTIRADFPHLTGTGPERYLNWFKEVCELTAVMIAHWMRVGFVHGVMNTDNMSVLGLTIDYGPYGWLEGYDPGWTPNTTDAHGRRYRFGNQPTIAQWNLLQLANAIYPLVEAAEPLELALSAYVSTYEQTWQDMMAQKLGLALGNVDSDHALVDTLLENLAAVETDMTLFFRCMAGIDMDVDLNTVSDAQLLKPFRNVYYSYDSEQALPREYVTAMGSWLRDYVHRVKKDGQAQDRRREAMNAVNPLYVPRNYLVQIAIDRAEQGDYSGVTELLDVLRRPYTEQPGMEKYAEKRPEWARHRAGCSMLSCSS